MRPVAEPIQVLYVDGDRERSERIRTAIEGVDREITVLTASSAADGLAVLSDRDVDCVVAVHELPETNGIELLDAVRERESTCPFVLRPDNGSEEIASEAISAGVTDYLQTSAGDDPHELLATRIRNAVEDTRTGEQTAVEHRINVVVRRINGALVRASTRDEIDERVCEIISDSEPYRFAWIGEYDENTDTVEPRTSAGTGDGYLEGLEITADDSPTGQGPTGRAIRNRELTVLQNIPETPEYEPWRDRALEYGYGSSAAVPLIYNDTLYGVLNVYADTKYAFDEHERELLSNLGETIAHAHRRIELQQQYTDQYRTLFQDAPVMLVSTRATGDGPVIEDCNRTFADRLGYTREELSDTRLADYYTTESAEQLLSEDGYRRALDGDFVREQRTLVTRDGEELLTVMRASPRQNTDGEIVGTHGLFVDITDEQQVRELERTNAVLSTLFDALPQGILVEDESRRVLLANERLFELFEFPASPEELVGEDCDRIARDVSQKFERPTEFVERIDDLIADRDPVDNEPLTLADGRTFERSYRPIELSESEGHLWVYRDVTDRTERERELERQNERLEEFTSVVSHDLRNPLSVARGRLELAREECDSDHLDHVERMHGRIETLIENLLTLAREGTSVSTGERVELPALIDGCAGNVEIDNSAVVVDLERTVLADRNRLKQVFENLLRNAAEHGGADVSVRIGELDDEDGFYVEDDGPGIPESDRDEVFEAGYSSSPEGTGFGLSIVKEIVEAHGWEIRVTEGTNGGARFEITGVEFEGG
ncbi:GAF domain-containing protein [Halalkaliarchaeum sp. AArc-GB]|uniref:GAF domain-containing protein n=1 Tax=Halalkaliarchaeum sp. AArc-GB TaxID=3074078 RepID=UPI002865A266|nr:GAF domain-containing protein [Halalkaliarchaeum sp. AArc-GB]MDR5673842.1 GAF domain-containing protein [Halalkaliarchaeum sp. AArc-GB]